jgi:hypothetical protein
MTYTIFYEVIRSPLPFIYDYDDISKKEKDKKEEVKCEM